MKNIESRLQRLEQHRDNTISPEVYKWLSEQMQAAADAFNSPEAMAKHEEEYREVQRIGELRKQAFERGEPMSNYPLPWEREPDADERRLEKILEM